MKLIVLTLALVAIAAAIPVSEVQYVEPEKILESVFDHSPDGHYNFRFKTENGIERIEEAAPKEVLDEENKPKTVLTVRGSYSYTNKEGKPELITYFADETGYYAQGDSIPKVESRR